MYNENSSVPAATSTSSSPTDQQSSLSCSMPRRLVIESSGDSASSSSASASSSAKDNDFAAASLSASSSTKNKGESDDAKVSDNQPKCDGSETSNSPSDKGAAPKEASAEKRPAGGIQALAAKSKRLKKDVADVLRKESVCANPKCNRTPSQRTGVRAGFCCNKCWKSVGKERTDHGPWCTGPK